MDILFRVTSFVNFYNNLVQISNVDLLLILQKLKLLKTFKRCCDAASFRTTFTDENVNGKYLTITNLLK